ncbi:MAG: FIST N-terminal domain-containing protein, partial [Burkholderiales bacterium]
MKRFAYAHAASADWNCCVAECAERIGRPQQGLGFVYFTEALAPQAERIVAALRQRTGVEDWVGTVGVGVLATGVEYQEEPALVAMVAALGPHDYRVFSGRTRLPPPGEQAAHFAVVHADPRTPDVAGLVADMASKVDSGYLVGGLSSSRSQTVQVANEVVSGGLSGVVLGPSVKVSTRLTQGCAPLPAPGSVSGIGRYRVTACDENVVAELDGRPALDVFRDAVGELLARDLRRAAAYVLAGLPVRGSDTGDYLVRNLVGIDPRNKLIAIGDVVGQGDEIIFCKRDAASADEDLRRILGELRASGPAPRGALYYS